MRTKGPTRGLSQMSQRPPTYMPRSQNGPFSQSWAHNVHRNNPTQTVVQCFAWRLAVNSSKLLKTGEPSIK